MSRKRTLPSRSSMSRSSTVPRSLPSLSFAVRPRMSLAGPSTVFPVSLSLLRVALSGVVIENSCSWPVGRWVIESTSWVALGPVLMVEEAPVGAPRPMLLRTGTRMCRRAQRLTSRTRRSQ